MHIYHKKAHILTKIAEYVTIITKLAVTKKGKNL